MKKFLTLTLFLLSISIFSHAQVKFAAGLSADIYGSKYIQDDDRSDVDLNDFHKVSVNFAPKLLVGVDLSKRVRILTGFGTFNRTDNFDFSSAPTTFTTAPGQLLIKNQYNNIPVLVLFNFLSKDSKSRLPLGLGMDFTSYKQTVYSSDNLNTFAGKDLPYTLKYDDVKSYLNKSMMAVSFQIGYGYEITDHIGIDATLFAKYDLKDFNTTYDLYDRFAFAGLNLMAMYKF